MNEEMLQDLRDIFLGNIPIKETSELNGGEVHNGRNAE